MPKTPKYFEKIYNYLDKASFRHGDVFILHQDDIDELISKIVDEYYDSKDFQEDAESYCRDSGWIESD